jgi:tRNA threonylcarbamoyladenosine biosynthesis protein TsaE
MAFGRAFSFNGLTLSNIMKSRQLKYLTKSDKETIDIGERLGILLSAGDVVTLMGSLGSGKTWFTKGIALGLDVDPREIITSPSFALVNSYNGRCQLYHMDLYRLENISDILAIGLEEYFHDESVVVVEWADHCPEIIPQKRIEVNFEILDENNRSISIGADHPHSVNKIKEIKY